MVKLVIEGDSLCAQVRLAPEESRSHYLLPVNRNLGDFYCAAYMAIILTEYSIEAIKTGEDFCYPLTLRIKIKFTDSRLIC